MSEPIKERQGAPWRCACGQQMPTDTTAVVTTDTDGRTIRVCAEHPTCGNTPMSRGEWNRFRHMCATCGEEAALHWRNTVLPAERQHKMQAAKALAARQQAREGAQDKRQDSVPTTL